MLGRIPQHEGLAMKTKVLACLASLIVTALSYAQTAAPRAPGGAGCRGAARGRSSSRAQRLRGQTADPELQRQWSVEPGRDRVSGEHEWCGGEGGDFRACGCANDRAHEGRPAHCRAPALSGERPRE